MLWQILSRMLWFAFAGAIVMPLVCGAAGGAVAAVLYVLFTTYSVIAGIPVSGETLIVYCFVGMVFPAVVSALVSFVAFGIAGIISWKKPLPDYVLSDITAESLHGALWGILAGVLLGPASYALFVLAIDSLRGVPSLFTWPQVFLSSAAIGFSVGIFIGAIIGALGQKVSMQNFFRCCRDWFMNKPAGHKL